MKLTHILIAAALFGCTEAPRDFSAETTEKPAWLPDPATYVEVEDRAKRGLNDDPYAGAINDRGEWAAFDGPEGGDGELEEKGNFVSELWGWAIDSALVKRCKNSQGVAIPCQFHYEPKNTNIATMADAQAGLRGRCGAFYSTRVPPLNLEGFACAYPFSTLENSGKTWSWKFVDTNCGDPLANDGHRATTAAAVESGMASVAAGTDWSFPKVSSSQKITIRCANATEKASMTAATSVGRGYPFGVLTFRGSAPFALTEQCSTDGALDKRFTQVNDEIWTYSKAEIVLNYDLMWQAATASNTVGNSICTAQVAADPSGFAFRDIQSTVKHEAGHALGFQHQNDVSGNDNVTNNMAPLGTCKLRNANPNFRQNMKDLLFDVHVGTNGDNILEVQDEDISCYKPL